MRFTTLVRCCQCDPAHGRTLQLTISRFRGEVIRFRGEVIGDDVIERLMRTNGWRWDPSTDRSYCEEHRGLPADLAPGPPGPSENGPGP